MLISAHALALNATLVTNNVKEFKRVKGLIYIWSIFRLTHKNMDKFYFLQSDAYGEHCDPSFWGETGVNPLSLIELRKTVAVP